jgi:hypothetical protein
LKLRPKFVISAAFCCLCLRRDFIGLNFHLLPAAFKRGHYYGFNNEQNIGLVGVMRAELGTLAGVKAALKERSEDGRLNCGPVQIGGGAKRAYVGGGQIKDGIIGK